MVTKSKAFHVSLVSTILTAVGSYLVIQQVPYSPLIKAAIIGGLVGLYSYSGMLKGD